jgi:hypothetical protein
MLRNTKAFLGIVLLLSASPASAGFIVGPGPVTVTNGDGLSYPLITVDLNAPATLGPGNYVVSQFNYRFSLYNGFETIGDITPIVLTGGGSHFTPVAVGSTITFNGPTAFISTPFGGSDKFTLKTTTTVYGGLYWNAPTFTGGPEFRMPIGSNNNAGGMVFNRQGGANFPVVGTPISGGSTLPNGFTSRKYDFNIQIDSATAAPEPSTLLLVLTGGVSLLGWCGVRRKRFGQTEIVA